MAERIVIRMPNWVGDLVMATPILTEVRRHYPRSFISAYCSEKLSPMLAHDQDIDEIISFAERKEAALARLRSEKFDLGLLLTNSFSSAWQFWRARVRRRIGFRHDYRSFLLSDPVALPRDYKEWHQVEVVKRLLEPLGIHSSAAAPRLHLLDSETQQAKDRLAKSGVPSTAAIVGINPGAAYGSAKCWLPERFAAVTEKLLKRDDLWVVYFGDKSQTELVAEVCKHIKDKSRVVNLAGATSLRELAALIKQCTVVLTNDSGPMHIAAALKTRVLALFGSTNEVRTGPYGQSLNVIHKHVACSPCYLRTCPIDFRCMKEIQAGEVYNRCLELVCG